MLHERCIFIAYLCHENTCELVFCCRIPADHDIVYIEYDIKAKRIQQAPRKIFLYKRADMDGLHDHLARYRDSFLSTDHSQVSVNDMWVSSLGY